MFSFQDTGSYLKKAEDLFIALKSVEHFIFICGAHSGNDLIFIKRNK